MRKEEKNQIIDELVGLLEKYPHFYITDISGLNAQDTSDLRRKCHEKEIKLKVAKNTLLYIALKKVNSDFEQFEEVLKGPSALMLSEVSNAPGKVIEEFRKNLDKPILKAAYVEESFYFGDDKIKELATLKSKEELLADVILLLQSPIKNVMSSLESGKDILAGLMKSLEEKGE
jgi:large subunit ribosomal protein L10